MRSYSMFAAVLATAAICFGQPPGGPPRPAGAKPFVRPPAYPPRSKADPAVLERGRALYGVNCNFCHGSDARGGEGGPNLIRLDLVLKDQNGELIAPIVQNGTGEMPKLNLSMAQIADIAAYIHDFPVGGYDISRMTPPSIVTGDAKAGEQYFGKVCASCHAVSGDLKAIAARFPDAKQLQQRWLVPGGGRGANPANRSTPVTVTVMVAGGKKYDGTLVRIDDFLVTLADKDGGQRTFSRNGDAPKVEIHDPLKPHKDLLNRYSDTDIHNVTAFLVTVK